MTALVKIEFQVPLLQLVSPIYLLLFPTYGEPDPKKKQSFSHKCTSSFIKITFYNYLDNSLTLHAENDKIVSDRKQLIT
jgi:hypothetical protein